MRTIVSGMCSPALIVIAAAAASVSAAGGQTTVIFNDSKPDVVYATLRAGAYADTNFPTMLKTRAADTASNHRHALLKFDTQNRIPAGSSVTSALLTLTVKSGSAADTTRTIGAYQVTTSWAETETTWNRRRKASAWVSGGGGDLGSLIAKQVVSNVAGTKVTFDITSLVKSAVAGKLGSSRYTRVALVDLDKATVDSTREFYTPDEANSALRPTLKVVYGKTTPSPPPPPPSSSKTLRVLQWNSQYGGIGTDGKSDPARFIKKAASFKPDIVSINEAQRFTSSANYDGPAKMAALMKADTGQTWYYKFTSFTGSANGMGNLILSRFPFDSSEVRLLSFDRAAIDVVVNVNGRSINFTSTHLNPHVANYRVDEIGELTAWAKGLAEPRIIAGDFNALPSSTENATMTATYVDSWAQAQSEGTAVAYPGNPAGHTRRARIDYIYYSKGATALKLLSSQVFDVRDANGVAPSDHRPVLSVFTVK